MTQLTEFHLFVIVFHRVWYYCKACHENISNEQLIKRCKCKTCKYFHFANKEKALILCFFVIFILKVDIFRKGVRAIQMANIFAKKRVGSKTDLEADVVKWQFDYLKGIIVLFICDK